MDWKLTPFRIWLAPEDLVERVKLVSPHWQQEVLAGIIPLYLWTFWTQAVHYTIWGTWQCQGREACESHDSIIMLCIILENLITSCPPSGYIVPLLVYMTNASSSMSSATGEFQSSESTHIASSFTSTRKWGREVIKISKLFADVQCILPLE